MEQDDNKKMYDYADRFINLANEMAQTDKSGTVGVAIRFAAARFSAFEASLQKKDMATEKDKLVQLFADDFKKMMQYNIEDYIRILSQQ